MRQSLYAYLAGKPILVKGVRQTKDGIPTILGDLVPKIRQGSGPAMALITTILCATRALRLGKEPDILAIIGDPKMGIPSIDKHVKSF